MNAFRRYGRAPFTVAVVHGGPGAAGEMAPVARELSKNYGVLEPLQYSLSLEGQIQELASVLKEHCSVLVNLVGHSYGAILAYLLAGRFPELVKKLVMVGSVVLEDRYAQNIMAERRRRLSQQDDALLDSLLNQLDDSTDQGDKNRIFGDIGRLMAKADAYDSLPCTAEEIDVRHDVHDAVWPGVAALRKSGELVAFGRNICCPVVAIHGDYDPHPAEGVRRPLSAVIKDFRFVLLEKCGHTPWRERQARDSFFSLLKAELA